MDRKMVDFIKEQYPPGTRIRLNAMEDPYHPILPGTEGEVDFVDDAGQLHMKWDNGRSLALIPGEDSFAVLPPKLTTLKLYMPLTADLYERNEYGEFDDTRMCGEHLPRRKDLSSKRMPQKPRQRTLRSRHLSRRRSPNQTVRRAPHQKIPAPLMLLPPKTPRRL